jgi:hypothetical protein
MTADPDITRLHAASLAGLLGHVAALAADTATPPVWRLTAISDALAGYGDPDDPAVVLTALLAQSGESATVTFERFTGGRLLRYDSSSLPLTRPVTGCESMDLGCCPGMPAVERFGQLVAEGGVTIADVSLVLLPQRLPRGVRTALARTRIPFGKLLTGVERRPVYARRTDDSDGHAISAEAVMVYRGKPVALAAERVRLGWVMSLSKG